MNHFRFKYNFSMTEAFSERFNVKLLGSCPEGWRRFGCSCYYLSTEKKSWEESRQDYTLFIIPSCVSNNDFSVSQQTFINGFKSVKYAWIGLTDSVTEGTWKWVDGSPLTTPRLLIGTFNELYCMLMMV
uniref:C-type lectin domain-containing protein n=1 Tax=Oncorhynchus mykiss TaxID=8022 RepID=A0A8C7TEV7_ONCMY